MDDLTLGLLELSEDLFFHKIPREKIMDYVVGAIEIGKDNAEKFRGADIGDLYKEHGIKIEEEKSGKGQFGVILRGQIFLSHKGSRVVVYENSIKALAENSSLDGNGIDYEQALNIHLAHEFFHYLEFISPEGTVADRFDRVETMKVLGFSRKAKIQRSSEVAAHSFAKYLLGLPYLPNYYDYAYLIGIKKLDINDLQRKIEYLKEEAQATTMNLEV